MSIYGKSKGDFLARIKVYPFGPKTKTRDTPAYNGVRWAFVYQEDLDLNGMPIIMSETWPEFIDEHGVAIKPDMPLIGTYEAKMHISSDYMREKHFKKLRIGTKFFCTEASMIVAEGTVTKLSL